MYILIFLNNLFVVVLGLHFCMGFSLNCGDWGHSLVVVLGLLTAAVSLAAEDRL